MEIRTFDFKKVSVVVDGVIITGYMDGESISVEKNEDDVTPHVGAGGDVTFAESNDETATITLTLKNTSSSLPYIRGLRKEKRNFPTQIVDSNNDTFRAGGNNCRIIKAPPVSYGNETTGVEVSIFVADYDEA